MERELYVLHIENTDNGVSGYVMVGDNMIVANGKDSVAFEEKMISLMKDWEGILPENIEFEYEKIDSDSSQPF